ncbi:MAG: hypothetical protein ACJ77M_02860 [Thermoleophilaceae bacterium]
MPRLAARAKSVLASLALAPIIASAPSGVTTDAAPTFAFAAKGRTECKIDWQPWSRCSSPHAALAPITGPHVFSVRAAESREEVPRAWTLVAACEPRYGSYGPGTWPPACWRPYSNASPFNRPLPLRPRIARGSRAVVSRLTSWGPPNAFSAGSQDTANDFAHPTYWSRLSDPRYLVRCRGCPIDGIRIRIPFGARPAAGADHHMTIVAQGAHREYDLWRAHVNPRRGVVTASGGGRISIDGSGLGAGATAAHFGNLAGIVREQELAAGEIDHALFMVVHCDGGTTVYPAAGRAFPCSAEGSPNRNAPPLGARFQLAMSDDQIRALGLPAWKQAIYTAMAHYGLIVGDTGGGASWGLQFESDSTYTSFGYPPALERFGAANPGDGFNGWKANATGGGFTFELDDPRIDWSQELRMVAPCVSAATC